MDDIQQQMEQWRILFKNKWANIADPGDETLFDEDFNNLVHSIVEECCKSLDPYEKEIEGLKASPDWCNGALHTISGCHGVIRRNFDWLQKKGDK